jgi:hypothetical protein
MAKLTGRVLSTDITRRSLMSEWVVCKVNNAGPAADGTETAAPTLYINLTESSGKFSGQWFFAASNAKSEMLAVALAAISLQTTVGCILDPPNANNTPFTQIYRLYLNANA